MLVHIMQMCITHCTAGPVDQMHQCDFSAQFNAQWIPKVLRSNCAMDTTLCTDVVAIFAPFAMSNREALNVVGVWELP